MKTPVIVSSDYIVYLEAHAGLSFIHCDCFGWTKAIKKALTEDLNNLFQIHRKPVFAVHEIGDEKHLKFLSIVGFTFFNTFIGTDNIMRHFYSRGL
jgi:hypothetical protein